MILVVGQRLSQNRLPRRFFGSTSAPPRPRGALGFFLQSKAGDANNIKEELTHQIRPGTVHHPQTGAKPLMKAVRGGLIYFLQVAALESAAVPILV